MVVVALLGCALFLLVAVGNAALLALAEHVPAAGPLRPLVLARPARAETEDLDGEHRELLAR